MNRYRVHVTLGVLVAALLWGGMGGRGFALAGKTKPTATINGPVMVFDPNGSGTPNFGETIRFDVTTTGGIQPFVTMNCYQNGALVGAGTRGYFPGSLDWPNGTFGLSSPIWRSGAADCTATVLYYVSSRRSITLTTLNFHVDA